MHNLGGKQTSWMHNLGGKQTSWIHNLGDEASWMHNLGGERLGGNKKPLKQFFIHASRDESIQ